jgi:hypothetical protein
MPWRDLGFGLSEQRRLRGCHRGPAAAVAGPPTVVPEFFCHVRPTYQPPAKNTFLSKQNNYQQPGNDNFLLEQINISYQLNE